MAAVGRTAETAQQLQKAHGRFAARDDVQTEFRDRLSAFVGLYAFVSQIIPYTDSSLAESSRPDPALIRSARRSRRLCCGCDGQRQHARCSASGRRGSGTRCRVTREADEHRS